MALSFQTNVCSFYSHPPDLTSPKTKTALFLKPCKLKLNDLVQTLKQNKKTPNHHISYIWATLVPPALWTRGSPEHPGPSQEAFRLQTRTFFRWLTATLIPPFKDASSSTLEFQLALLWTQKLGF